MDEQNQTKRKKSTKYLLIGTLVLFLSILGSSVAYYLARVQGNLSGRAAGTELAIQVQKISSNANMDLIPLDNDLETLQLAAAGYQDKGACVDINGYSVCQIYKITVTNNGSVPLTMNGTVTLSGQNTPNIDCATMTNATTVANNNSCMGQNVFVSGDTLPANDHKDYYVMVYINNLDEPQYDSGEFNGVVIFTTEDGKKIKGRFTKPFNLVQHISNLYNDAEKTVITANAEQECIEYNTSLNVCKTLGEVTKTADYNYATSVNLMNDRLGGTTEDLDGGNIRYYGAEPNNFIDIGDRTTNNEVILWRIIGIFDGEIRIVRNESIGLYSWDTSPADVNVGFGINEWSQADLMKLLNPEYESNLGDSCSNCVWNSSKGKYDCDCIENTLVNNSLYWNSQSGTCYNERNNQTGTCDFTSIGLSEGAKEYVVDQTIYLGGFNIPSVFANQAYELERGSNVIQNPSDGVTRTLSWTGKVGLPYPSDYGYAADLTNCQQDLYRYDNETCVSNNWLKDDEYFKWLITPRYDKVSNVLNVLHDHLNNGTSLSSGAYVHPVLTITPEALVESGDGSKLKPYVLS